MERATVPIHSAAFGATSSATDTNVDANTMPLITSSTVSGSLCIQPGFSSRRVNRWNSGWL